MKFKQIPCYVYADYKLYITAVLLTLTIVNIFEVGMSVLYQVLAAVLTAFVLDSLLIKWRSNNWYFPSGAVISSIIIAQLISTTILTVIAVVALSILMKYLFRPQYRNLFNPAALSVAIATLLFPLLPFTNPIFSSWWASSKYVMPALGLLLVILIKRWNTALSFLLPFAVLNAFRFGVDFAFQSLLTGSWAYFAFIMVVEPVTTPTTNRNRIIFGISVAVLAFALSYWPWALGNSFFLYLPLMAMNLAMRLLPKNMLS